MRRRIAIWLAMLSLLAGVALGEVYTGIDQLDGTRIGVQTGTSFDRMVTDRLPNAQVEYYNTKADLVAALTGQKVEAFAMDEPVVQLLMGENDQITYLPEYLDAYEFALVFPKTAEGEALRGNEYSQSIHLVCIFRRLPADDLNAIFRPL